MSTLSRERIAQAAMDLADAEGMEAVSMRRVAAALGVGTMSLYHYVRTKDELLGLMGDAITGEFLIPDGEMPADWRAGLAEIARRTRAAFDRHPWMLLGMLHGPDDPPGRNLMRHADQTLGTLAAYDLTPVERIQLTGTVDEYVIGHVFRRRVEVAEQDRVNFTPRMRSWFDEIVSSGEFPHFQTLFGPGQPTSEDAMRVFEEVSGVDSFERGLTVVLDGIAAALAGRER